MTIAEAPEAVRERFEELKRNFPFPIVLRKISDRYYLYKQIARRNPKTGKTEIVEAKYLGKMTDTGAFVAKGIKKPEYDLEVAKTVIMSHGGKVIMPQESEGRILESNGIQLTEVEQKILTNLSMNARMPTPMLARKLNMKEDAVGARVKKLEKLLGINYTAYVRLLNLGFLYFVVFVKFLGAGPNPTNVKADIESVPEVQFAAFTKGEYDMFIYLVADTTFELLQILERLKIKDSLKDISAKWDVSLFYPTYHVVPLRDAFFTVLEKRIWRRTKGHPRPLPNQLLQSEFSVLRELNRDSSVPFAKIERDNNMAKGSARYIYEKLKEKEIIENATITMSDLGVRYNALILLEILEERNFRESRKSLLEYIVEESPKHIINKFSLIGDINVPYGILFAAPILEPGQLELIENTLRGKVKGIKISSLSITDILVGRPIYRRFDNLYSVAYETLVSDYKVTSKNRERYEEIESRLERIR